MPRPRFDNLDTAKRRSLLEGAAMEFAEHGYDRASLNRILGAAGLSKGAFYYYFDDKADLFATVMKFASEAGVGQIDFSLEALEGPTFWDSLWTVLEASMPRTSEMPWAAGLGKLVYQPPADPRARQAVEEVFDRAHRWLAMLLERGRALEAVRSDLPIALQERLVAGALEGSDQWFVDEWEGLSEAQRLEHTATVFQTVRRMVEAV